MDEVTDGKKPTERGIEIWGPNSGVNKQLRRWRQNRDKPGESTVLESLEDSISRREVVDTALNIGERKMKLEQKRNLNSIDIISNLGINSISVELET